MLWFRRRLRWEETATRQVPSVHPGSAGHGVVANRRVEVDGVEVLGLNGRGIAINPDTQLPYVAVVASMMAVELSRPLLPFLVGNDLFEAVGELTPAPPWSRWTSRPTRTPMTVAPGGCTASTSRWPPRCWTPGPGSGSSSRGVAAR
ncbi:hypothetical protein GCM10027030_28220 [Luteococcus sediminum]